MALPLGGTTIDKFEEENFALYLRGFSSDSYEASISKMVEVIDNARTYKIRRQKKDVSKLPFSERDFAKAVKRFMPVYCVGMTREIESPEGCKRIYLNDEEWQTGVKLLIEKAKYVFILVNPSESCIWEIIQSHTLALDKTLFFVDNPNYIDVLKSKMEYNSIPECIRYSCKHTYNYIIDGVPHSYVYTNDLKGFANALNVFFKDKELAKQERIKNDNLLLNQTEKEQYDYSRFMPK